MFKKSTIQNQFKLNNRGFSTLIGILIVVVLAVAVAVIVIWQQKKLEKETTILEIKLEEKTKKEESKEVIEDKSEKITQDETINWKIYRDEDYKYEIKYPNDWKFSTNSPSYEGYPVFESSDFPILSDKLEGARVVVFIRELKKNLYKDWETQVREEGLAPNLYTMVKVNNKDCLQMTLEVEKANKIGGIERFEKDISCSNNNGTKIATFFIQSERLKKEIYLSIFDQILSTFRFLE